MNNLYQLFNFKTKNELVQIIIFVKFIVFNNLREVKSENSTHVTD